MVIEEIDRTDSSVASEDRIEDARASEDSDDSDFDVGEEDRIEDVDVDMADFRKHTNGNVEWVEYDNECERKKALKKLAKTHKPVDGQMYTENFYVGQTLANKQLIKGMCRGLVPVFGNGPSDSGLGDSGPVCDKPKLDSGSNKKTKKKGQVEDSNKCPWLLHCSKSKNAKTWWVKKTDDNHTCLQSRTVRKCTASFLSKEVEETIKPDPKVPISALKDQLQRKYELGMPDMKLRQYALELKEQNPDTTIKIDVERCFDRSLGARDPDNGICPLAYAVVESETKDSWLWFLDCLGDDLELFRNFNFTFISDRQKRFGKNMEEIKKFNKEMYEWLKDIPPHHWARSYFYSIFTHLNLSLPHLLLNVSPYCDVLLNNMREVLNRQLLNGRDKPIITCLEFIREYLMKRIVIVQGVIRKSIGPPTPSATKVFNVIKREAAQYKVVWNGGDLKWEITGMPCKHAMASIWNMTSNGLEPGIPKSWVHETYWLKTWEKMYSYKINPCNGPDMWPQSDNPITLTPPNYKPPIGRPPKKRRKSAVEIYDGLVKKGRLSRVGKTVTCLKCRQQGHNKRSCKGQRQKGSASGSQAPPQAPSQTTTQAFVQAPQSSTQPSQASAQAPQSSTQPSQASAQDPQSSTQPSQSSKFTKSTVNRLSPLKKKFVCPRPAATQKKVAPKPTAATKKKVVPNAKGKQKKN
ncbi:hypothetical protein Tco_1319108 [Tanacetum coccineum]